MKRIKSLIKNLFSTNDLPLKDRITKLDVACKILKNKNIPLADRDDVAMDLKFYDEPDAENTLSEIVLDDTEDPLIIDTVLESIAYIWKRKGIYRKDFVNKIPEKFSKEKNMFLNPNKFQNDIFNK